MVIYLVSDRNLTLPPEQERHLHDARRPFLILSGSITNSNKEWPIVLGCPISSSTKCQTRFDVKLAANEAGVDKKCWIRIPALQPLSKDDLEDRTGVLPAPRLEEVQTRVLEYLGLVESTTQDDYGEPF